MIVLGSRYQNERLTTITNADGEVQTFVLRSTRPFAKRTQRVHLWRDSDRIDRVAEQYLGSASAWWRVLDVNPEILDPNRIPLGTAVRIPDA